MKIASLEDWRVLAALCLALVLLSSTNLTVALLNRGTVKAIQAEQTSFRGRTVKRWDYLHRHNPALDVPVVDEQVEAPEMPDVELERPVVAHPSP